MRLFYALLINLLILIIVVVVAALSPQVPEITGIPHPEIPGLMIRNSSIYETTLTKYLGLLWALSLVVLLFIVLLIGNRRYEKNTGMSRWIYVCMCVFIPVFLAMIITDWQAEDYGFFTWLPVSTAWTIYGVWFVPVIITLAYFFTFDQNILSEEEEKEFMEFIKDQSVDGSV